MCDASTIKNAHIFILESRHRRHHLLRPHRARQSRNPLLRLLQYLRAHPWHTDWMRMLIALNQLTIHIVCVMGMVVKEGSM